jgi:hypothetical protein
MTRYFLVGAAEQRADERRGEDEMATMMNGAKLTENHHRQRRKEGPNGEISRTIIEERT